MVFCRCQECPALYCGAFFQCILFVWRRRVTEPEMGRCFSRTCHLLVQYSGAPYKGHLECWTPVVYRERFIAQLPLKYEYSAYCPKLPQKVSKLQSGVSMCQVIHTAVLHCPFHCLFKLLNFLGSLWLLNMEILTNRSFANINVTHTLYNVFHSLDNE